MTSNLNEDQAEQLRKRFETGEDQEIETEDTVVDVLNLPSRKEKYKKNKQKKKKNLELQEEKLKKETKPKRKKVRFPLVKFLLFLFLLLVVLVTTYPMWIEKLNL